MQQSTNTEPLTAAGAYILNQLASASQAYTRATARARAELNDADKAQFQVPTYGQPFTDLLTIAGKVNALIEVATSVATSDQIALARTGQHFFGEQA